MSGLRFLLDHNIPRSAVWVLVQRGLDTMTAKEAGKADASDEELYAYCHEQERILVTLDKDFLSPARYAPGPGRIVLRPRSETPEAILPLLEKALSLGGYERAVLVVWQDQVMRWGDGNAP